MLQRGALYRKCKYLVPSIREGGRHILVMASMKSLAMLPLRPARSTFALSWRWLNRSSWIAELGEWDRVKMNFEVLGREIFIRMS